MQGKRILLGVTGGIAAYKSADLVRRLIEHGAQVQVVMTAAAREFVTPTTFQALSGRTVRTDLWDAAAEAAMGHIELARWAELVLVAPASADFLARLAHGLADDLLTTLCLASAAPIAVAPAMNQLMWGNAATRSNVELLTARGVHLIGPGVGDQACGEHGPGRLLEPTEIVSQIALLLAPAGPLLGRRVLLTAGPTRECIDPVRFVSNRSSGKMGFAMAQAMRAAGAASMSRAASRCTRQCSASCPALRSLSVPRPWPITGRLPARRRRSRRAARRWRSSSRAPRIFSRRSAPARSARSWSGSRPRPTPSSITRAPSCWRRTWI